MAQMKRGNSNGHPRAGKPGTKQVKMRNFNHLFNPLTAKGKPSPNYLARLDWDAESEGEEKDRIIG